MTLISQTFDALKSDSKKALIPFLTADFPNRDTFIHLLHQLPKYGANIIEIGIPFSDPMADGEVIQKTSLQAINNGFKLNQLLNDIQNFKLSYPEVPIVLMTYLNPIHRFGIRDFLMKAQDQKVDAILFVDLPPEQHKSLIYFDTTLDFIRLITPTSNTDRLPIILNNSSGFLYYVSVKGITGTKMPEAEIVQKHLQLIRSQIELPLVIGFGISNPKIAADMAEISDGIIVGSSFIRPFLSASEQDYVSISNQQLSFIHSISKAINYGTSF